MDEKAKIKEEFSELCFCLDEKDVIEMSQTNLEVSLNNVVVGLSDECFGLALSHDTDKVSYQLFYVNGKKGLTGYLLNMNLKNPNRDDLVFMFANHLTQKYVDLDLIDVFNTFQLQTRSMLEKEGHFTVSSLEMEKYRGQDVSIAAKGVKGIELIPLIDKVKFFQEYFGNRHVQQQTDGENYVYLLLNKRNGLIKIGTSIKPSFREKTLQSQEPEIVLLAIWTAPKEIERELHKKFSDNKRRGEWFDLRARDMKEIKERMIAYN